MSLFEAIRAGQTSDVRKLIEQNPELANQSDERGFTPLIMAAYMGQKEIAELLLEMGADIDGLDAVGSSALMGVSFKGDIEIASMLIEKGANIHVENQRGETALSFAKNYQQTEIEAMLVEAGME
jgi:uncharacterized protein